MQLEYLKISIRYQYFWLKKVRSVCLSQHCASCLVGEYVPNVPKCGELYNVQLEDAVYYLCGVSRGAVWEKNFHLAFRPKPGGVIEINDEEKGVAVRILDAEPLPISESDIDETNPHANERLYRRCRNWQFAHYFAKHLMEKK